MRYYQEQSSNIRFSDGMRGLLERSLKEAKDLNYGYIGTEHLLLGLITGEESDPARQALTKLNVTTDNIRRTTESYLARNQRPPQNETIGLTPRASLVVSLAGEEAISDGAVELGTDHLLLGLVREGEGLAAGILEIHGVTLNRVRQVVKL